MSVSQQMRRVFVVENPVFCFFLVLDIYLIFCVAGSVCDKNYFSPVLQADLEEMFVFGFLVWHLHPIIGYPIASSFLFVV